MNHRLLPLLPLLLGGCLQSAPAAIAPAKTVTVSSRVEVTQAPARRVQTAEAPVEAWKKADIHHADLTLYRVAGEHKVKLSSLTVQQADLDKAVKFSSLSTHTDYLVEARAYADAAAAVAIDDLEAEAASCQTSFRTSGVLQLDVGVIKLRLRDKLYSGTARSTGVEVTDGAVVGTTATPTIEVIQAP